MKHPNNLKSQKQHPRSIKDIAEARSVLRSETRGVVTDQGSYDLGLSVVKLV